MNIISYPRQIPSLGQSRLCRHLPSFHHELPHPTGTPFATAAKRRRDVVPPFSAPAMDPAQGFALTGRPV